MKKIILSFSLVAILASHSSQAATVLAAGDVQIIGYREDPLDGFMFVLWKDIDATTVLRFTDNSFSSATTANTTEGILSWTSGASLSSGTVVKIFGSGSSTTVETGMQTSTGSSTMSGSMNLAVSGDSLYVYQGTLNSGQTPIYAMDFESATAGNIGFVPNGLTSGSTAFLFTGANDNAYYNGTRTFTAYGPDTAANVAAAKAAILNAASWTKSADGAGADFSTTTGAGFSTTSFVTTVTGYFWNGGAGTWNYTAPNWVLNGAGGATNFVSGSDAWVNGGTLTVQDEGITAGAVGFWGATNTVLQGGTLTATSLSKSGTGALTLDNTNNVQNFVLDNASVSGAGLVNASVGSTVTVASGTNTISVLLGGTGSLTKAGAGTAVLTASNTYTGDTISTGGGVLLTSGNERISDASVLKPSTGSTIRLGGNETVRAVDSANTTSVIDIQSYNLTIGAGSTSNSFTGNLTGSGSVTKIGSGIQTFGSNNSWTGGFTMKEGTVRITANGSLTNLPGSTVTNQMQTHALGTGTITLEGGTLQSSSVGTDLSTTTGRTLYNSVNLNGGFTSGAAGEVGRIAFSTNAGGSTVLSKDSTINTVGNVEWNQTITGSQYRLTKTGVATLSLGNSNNFADITVQQGTLGYGGSRNALGLGTVILNDGTAIGQNSSISGNVVEADRFVGNNISVLGNITLGAGSSTYLSGNIDLNNASRTFTLANSTHLSGAITNGGGLVVTRLDTELTTTKSLNLYGANTYTGGTTVMASTNWGAYGPTLALGNDRALGSGDLTFSGVGTNTLRATTLSTDDVNRTITNNIVLNNSSTDIVTITNLVTGTQAAPVTNSVLVNMALNGVISGGGALVKSNANTLTLNGANTYTGGTTVNGGTLMINGAVGQVIVNAGGSLGGSGTVGAVTLNSGSFLKPGNSPGNLTAASSVWNGGATYEWQIASLSGVAGTDWDLFTVNGTLDLSSLSASSQFNLALDSAGVLAGFDGASDYSWTFAKATGLTGVSAVAGTDITSLFAISTALFNAGNGPQNGFQVLVGDTTGGFTSLKLVTASVPEPSTPALLMFGLAGLLGLRTLRRKA